MGKAFISVIQVSKSNIHENNNRTRSQSQRHDLRQAWCKLRAKCHNSRRQFFYCQCHNKWE